MYDEMELYSDTDQFDIDIWYICRLFNIKTRSFKVHLHKCLISISFNLNIFTNIIKD